MGYLLELQNYDLAIEFFQELMIRDPTELITIGGFVWALKTANRVSDFQIFISKLIIDGSWDIVDLYEDNI